MEDTRVKEKEEVKAEKCQNPARELRNMWNTWAKVLPIVMGALGIVPRRLLEYLLEYLRMIGASMLVGMIQKTALWGLARILRKVIEL